MRSNEVINMLRIKLEDLHAAIYNATGAPTPEVQRAMASACEVLDRTRGFKGGGEENEQIAILKAKNETLREVVAILAGKDHD